VMEDVRKLFVGRRPGEKVELRAGNGLRRAGLLATRDMMAVARSSIEVLGWMENGGRAGQYQPSLLGICTSREMVCAPSSAAAMTPAPSPMRLDEA
jgi:hypothetical protein